MSFISGMLNQNITIWVQNGTDQFGKPKFNSPTTVKGRREQKSELFKGSDATDKVTTAIFYTESTIPTPRSWVYLGTSTASDPTAVSNAAEIEQVQIMPSVNAQITLTKILV